MERIHYLQAAATIFMPGFAKDKSVSVVLVTSSKKLEESKRLDVRILTR